MVSATSAAFAALLAALTAVELLPFLTEPQSRSGTSASTSTPAASTFDDSTVQLVFLPLAATVTFFAAVGNIYLHHAAFSAAVGAGSKSKRLPEVVPFVLCGAAGVLLFVLFVLPAAGGGVDDDALGARAAVRALPAVTTVTFFLGLTLVIAHVRAGGEGGGGDKHRRVPVPVVVDVLKKIALGAAAALLGQIAMATL